MILCCGEALVDMIPTSKDGGFKAHVGGAVFNTAIALGRLGADVGFLYGLSTDEFGELISNALAESNVDYSLALRTDRPTTRAIVSLENGIASYRFEDDKSAGRMLRPEDMPTLEEQIEALFFGGISLAAEPSGDAFVSLLENQARGRLVMLDPNIRPAFIADEKRYRQRITKMIKRTDILKVSDEDLDWMAPGPEGLEFKMTVLSEAGPTVVIVTRGSKGAMARLPDGSFVSVGSLPVGVVDTVGAGDTFNAGFLSWLAENSLLNKAAVEELSVSQVKQGLALASKVAAITVSRVGANPPRANEL